MDSYIVLSVMVGSPALLALLLRVSAVVLFVSVAAGALLVQYFADDVTLVFTSFFTSANVDQYVSLGLLVLPLLLTLYMLRKTLTTAQLIFHLLPIVATSGAFACLVLVNLPGGVRHDITSNPFGKILENSQDVLIAASSILTLLLAWFTMRSGKHKKH